MVIKCFLHKISEFILWLCIVPLFFQMLAKLYHSKLHYINVFRNPFHHETGFFYIYRKP